MRFSWRFLVCPEEGFLFLIVCSVYRTCVFYPHPAVKCSSVAVVLIDQFPGLWCFLFINWLDVCISYFSLLLLFLFVFICTAWAKKGYYPNEYFEHFFFFLNICPQFAQAVWRNTVRVKLESYPKRKMTCYKNDIFYQYLKLKYFLFPSSNDDL